MTDFLSDIEATMMDLSINLDDADQIIAQASDGILEVADVLDAMSDSLWIQVGAGDVAQEAGEAVIIMTAFASNISEFSVSELKTDIDTYRLSLSELKTDIEGYELFLNELILHLDIAENYVITITNALDSWNTRIQTVSQSVDSWTQGLQIVGNNLWLIEYLIYGVIGYIGILHIAFIVIGVTFRKISQKLYITS
jgi:hypothetical protein